MKRDRRQFLTSSLVLGASGILIAGPAARGQGRPASGDTNFNAAGKAADLA